MCGIYGSSDIEKFHTLYRLNSRRGNFAWGNLYRTNECYFIEKHPGVLSEFHQFKIPFKETIKSDYFLGHTQAPTSSQRAWREETSHPFKWGDWIVAHNGIIKNFELLKKSYACSSFSNPVDSSIIPVMVDLFNSEHKLDAVGAIKKTAELLEGTFACWLYQIPTGRIFLIRCASTLYVDNKCNFSSVLFDPHCVELKEGIIYEMLETGPNCREIFKYNSPFLAL